MYGGLDRSKKKSKIGFQLALRTISSQILLSLGNSILVYFFLNMQMLCLGPFSLGKHMYSENKKLLAWQQTVIALDDWTAVFELLFVKNKMPNNFSFISSFTSLCFYFY